MEAAEACHADPVTHISCLPGDVLSAIIFSLNSKDVAVCSVVCSAWRSLASHDPTAKRAWKRTYLSRWAHPHEHHALDGRQGGTCWQALYGAKMRDLKSYAGKSSIDMLYGHAHGVRCCRLLPQYSMMVSGSLDRTVKLWDLQQGLPLASSRPIHKGTVRSVAIDSKAIVSASADSLIRVWLPSSLGAADRPSSTQRPHFELARAPSFVLHGHRGPVVSLSLTDTCLYSGSWDYSVRIWARGDDCGTCGSGSGEEQSFSSIRKGGGLCSCHRSAGWQCCSVLTYDDWVSCVSARGPHLYVCAGTELVVHDIETAKPVRRMFNQEGGSVLCVEASQSGRIVFTGSTDGAVRMYDLRARGDGGHILWQHAAAVQDLSFEDPWLASVASDGTLAILDTESCAPGCDTRGGAWGATNCGIARGSSGSGGGNTASRSRAAIQGGPSANGRGGFGGMSSSVSGSGAGGRASVRQLQAGCGTAYSVHLAEQWLVCGGASNVVRVWDFRGAHHHSERVAAAKVARLASKEARQLAQQERQAQRLQAQLARQHQQQEAVEQEQIRLYMQDQQQQQQQQQQHRPEQELQHYRHQQQQQQETMEQEQVRRCMQDQQQQQQQQQHHQGHHQGHQQH